MIAKHYITLKICLTLIREEHSKQITSSMDDVGIHDSTCSRMRTRYYTDAMLVNSRREVYSDSTENVLSLFISRYHLHHHFGIHKQKLISSQVHFTTLLYRRNKITLHSVDNIL